MTTENDAIVEKKAIPFSTVGFLTAKRTYCRRLDPDDPNSDTEEFEDVIDRVMKATVDQLSVDWDDGEYERAREYMLALKGSVAGRFLWQLGTPTVSKLGLASLMNCCFVTVDEPRAFTWAYDNLMLGSGVGYNIQRENVYKLSRIRKDFLHPVRDDGPDADFIVPDSREGWVRLLDMTLKCAFVGEKSPLPQGFTYSAHCIRGKGAPIKGFGGTASGPEDLCWGISEISKILMSRRGKQLRPIDCLDVMNIIGAVVVSGNVRRSAQIAIGDYDDLQFLKSKDWSSGVVPNWRAMSNNSVVCNDIALLPQAFWDTYEGGSEPFGLINLRLSRTDGRLGDTSYPDPDVEGYNPCAEQSLANNEVCCLGEVFLPNIPTKDELFDVVRILYKICKHSLALPCHHEETEKIVHKNMRIGIGVTGYLQATEEQRSWLSECYEELRRFDVEYSAKHKWPASIKLCTTKPSGTLSLLPGVTPGCHPGFAQYMIRRIRISSNHALVDVCRQHGYNVEYQINFDGSKDHSTVVVEFPFSYPEGTVLAKDMTAIDQLEVVKRLQTEWSDNSVSCTVYYTKEQLPTIREYLLKNYNNSFKTLSFLLQYDAGWKQMPFEEITKEEYDGIVSRTTIITSLKEYIDMDDSLDCSSGSCPIR